MSELYEVVDTGDLAEVPPEQRLDYDEPDNNEIEELGDIYENPGEIVELAIPRSTGLTTAVAQNYAGWSGARTCTGSATPGARALMAWCLEEYSEASNLGIYNCRSVRGAATTSLHGEGRALDVAFPGARGNEKGHELRRRLGAVGRALGIQTIIYCRVIYSAKSPTGREYNGVAPHWDHLHIELTREAAQKLTLATVRRLLKTTPAPARPTPAPTAKGDDFMGFVDTQDEFNAAVLAAFRNPKVATELQVSPWRQKLGRTNRSMHDAFGEMESKVNVMATVLTQLAAKVGTADVDEKALAAALAPVLVTALRDAGVAVTDEQFERVLRDILGSVDSV